MQFINLNTAKQEQTNYSGQQYAWVTRDNPPWKILRAAPISRVILENSHFPIWRGTAPVKSLGAESRHRKTFSQSSDMLYNNVAL